WCSVALLFLGDSSRLRLRASHGAARPGAVFGVQLTREGFGAAGSLSPLYTGRPVGYGMHVSRRAPLVPLGERSSGTVFAVTGWESRAGRASGHFCLEILQGFLQAGVPVHFRLPAEQLFGPTDVG